MLHTMWLFTLLQLFCLRRQMKCREHLRPNCFKNMIRLYEHITNSTAHGAPTTCSMNLKSSLIVTTGHWCLARIRYQASNFVLCSRVSTPRALAEPGQKSPESTTKSKGGCLFPSSAGTLSRSSPVENRGFFRFLRATI